MVRLLLLYFTAKGISYSSQVHVRLFKRCHKKDDDDEIQCGNNYGFFQHYARLALTLCCVVLGSIQMA